MHRPLAPEGRAVRLRPPEGAVPCSVASRPWVLAATILASAMAFIDGSVVTIALPVLQRELGAGLASLQWVVNGYTLFLAALLLVGGAAGDRFGRRRVFLAGTVVFAAASAACALAPGVGALVAARAVQGIGAALMVPQSLAIISAAFPQEIRGRAIGTWAGAAALTTALGPALGGFLIDSLGWRAAFWLNLPLAVAVVALTRAHVPESRAPVAGPIDWAGGVLAVLASAALTLGLTALAEPAAPGWHAWALLAAGGLLTIGFVRVERAAAAPLVPPQLFAIRAFAGANLLTLFLYGALSAVIFLLPFELIAPARAQRLRRRPRPAAARAHHRRLRPAGGDARRSPRGAAVPRGRLGAGRARGGLARPRPAGARRRGAGAGGGARRRDGAGGGAADDRGDERGARRAGRCRLRGQQRGEPARRALRGRARRRRRGGGLRGGGRPAGGPVRGAAAGRRSELSRGRRRLRPRLCGGHGGGRGAGGAGRARPAGRRSGRRGRIFRGAPLEGLRGFANLCDVNSINMERSA